MGARRILQLEGKEVSQAELNTLLKQISDRILTLEEASIAAAALTSSSSAEGGTLLYSRGTSISSDAGGTETTFGTVDIDANTYMANAGDRIVCEAWWIVPAASTWTYKTYYGSASHSFTDLGYGAAAIRWFSRVEFIQTGASAQNILAQSFGYGVAAGSTNSFRPALATGTQNNSGTITVKTTGTDPSVMTEYSVMIWSFLAP